MGSDNTAVSESFSAVLDDELDAIRHSRSQMGLRDPGEKGESYQKAQDLNLKGLALSGGGIRSATFNLGILQALSESHVLSRFDYLSTVSGGGYIGSWLSGLIYNRQSKHGRVDFPEIEKALSPTPPHSEGQSTSQKDQEDKAIGFLREYSNYLTPKVGLLSTDTLTGIATYLRNLTLVQAMIVSLLLGLLLIPRLLHPVAEFVVEPALWNVSYAGYLVVILLIVSVIGIGKNLGADKQSPCATTAFVVFLVMVPGVLGATCLSLELANPVSSLLLALTANDWPPLLPWIAGMAAFYSALTVIAAAVAIPKRSAPADGLSNHDKGPACADVSVGRWLNWGLMMIVISGAIAGAVGGAGLYYFRELLITIQHYASSDAMTWFAFAVGPFVILQIFSLMIIVHVGLVGRIFDYQLHEWWARYGALTIAVTICVGGGFAIAVYSPVLVEYGWQWVLFGGGPAWLITTIWGIYKGASSTTSGDSASWTERLLSIAPYVFIIGLMIALSSGIHQTLLPSDSTPVLLANSCSATHVPATPCLSTATIKVAGEMSQTCYLAVFGFWLGCLVTFLMLAWRVDINLFSLHNFYRNRLTRCYLGAARMSSEPSRENHPFTGFDSKDDIALADLGNLEEKKAQRPFHILNTALNMSSGRNLAWQQRKAASFFFTPFYCGFKLPSSVESDVQEGRFVKTRQYMPTTTILGPTTDKGPMLGSVVATSGAAASPNWGFHTSPGVAFLLALFNVRLGRWCPNPAHKPVRRRQSPLFGGEQLVQELLGQTDSTSGYVYLSDGGHFDNLGIYELVRRRVKVIVACDCGQDEDMSFDDLADTIRKCSTDFGAQIVIDIDQLKKHRKPGLPRLSDRHAVQGTIFYPEMRDDKGQVVPAFEGTLVLIKPTLAEWIFKAAPDLRNYALANKEFPQQTTADQWFDEAQFESYRKLGYLIGRWALTEKAFNEKTLTEIVTEEAPS